MPLRVIREPAEMRSEAENLRRDGRRICVVPTMGALHEGHLSLLDLGRARCDVLVLTLFVNPTQFGEGEDLEAYPRTESRDLELAGQRGVDIAFCPTASALYSPGYQTTIEVRDLAAPMCGRTRPTHFAGVASVVAKLFHLTQPHLAVFGEKDYQQLAIVRRMVSDLDFGVDIVGGPIVRESDGLAMSSRNAYLSPEERRDALSLHRGLCAARAAYDSGERSCEALARCARAPIESTSARIDYLEIRDAASLESLELVDTRAVVAVAAYLGTTRLIDNIVLD